MVQQHGDVALARQHGQLGMRYLQQCKGQDQASLLPLWACHVTQASCSNCRRCNPAPQLPLAPTWLLHHWAWLTGTDLSSSPCHIRVLQPGQQGVVAWLRVCFRTVCTQLWEQSSGPPVDACAQHRRRQALQGGSIRPAAFMAKHPAPPALDGRQVDPPAPSQHPHILRHASRAAAVRVLQAPAAAGAGGEGGAAQQRTVHAQAQLPKRNGATEQRSDSRATTGVWCCVVQQPMLAALATHKQSSARAPPAKGLAHSLVVA